MIDKHSSLPLNTPSIEIKRGERGKHVILLPQIESVVITFTEIAPVQIPGEALKVVLPVASHPDRGLRGIKDHLVQKLLGSGISNHGQRSLDNLISHNIAILVKTSIESFLPLLGADILCCMP